MPAITAKDVSETFPLEMPLAAELYKVVQKEPYLDIYFILLGPGAHDPFWKNRDDPLSKKKRNPPI